MTNKYDKILRWLYWLIIFSIIVAGGYFITEEANWIFGDDHEWLVSTAIDLVEPMSVHIGNGRFVPLGHYDFNWLTLLPGIPSPFIHYLWIAFLFVIFICSLGLLLFQITQKASSENKAYLCFSLLSLLVFLIRPETANLFMSVIYPDRMVTVMLSLFMFFTYRSLQSDSLKDYIPALLSAVYASYCKEPVFGIFIIVASVNIIFNYKMLTRRQRLFNISLLLNGVVFITLYYFIAFRQTAEFYRGGNAGELPRLQMLMMLLNGIKIYYLILLLALYRGVSIIFLKDKQHLYYDGLLLASVGYFAAFNMLQFYQSYYFYPGIFLALPAFVYFGIKLGQKNILLMLLFAVILLGSNRYNFDGLELQIQKYQLQRRTDRPVYEKIAVAISKGHQIYWFQTEPLLPEHAVYKDILSWRRVISQRFLNYLLKTSDEEYLPIISSYQKLNIGDILLYPVDNLLEKQGADAADKMIEDNDLIETDNVGEISIFQHSSVEPVKLPAVMDFSNHKSFLLNGFSYAEGTGRWTEGEKASIKFKLAEVPEQGIKLSFSGFPLLTEKNEVMKIEVKANKKTKTVWFFETGKPQSELQLQLSEKELSYNLIQIEFKIYSPHSPQELGIGGDNRLLGFHFQQVKLEEIP